MESAVSPSAVDVRSLMVEVGCSLLSHAYHPQLHLPCMCRDTNNNAFFDGIGNIVTHLDAPRYAAGGLKVGGCS